jgi:hypothetical protein
MASRRILTLIATLIGLSGCAAPGAERVATEPTSPHSLVYTYLMAHGMAYGYVMASGPNTPNLNILVALDHNAWVLVLNELKAPSDRHLAQANGAVDSLIAAVTPPDTAPTVDHRGPR